MQVIEIKTDDYHILYQPETQTLYLEGLLREGAIADYKSIEMLLNELLIKNLPILNLNLQNLHFIDSSAISLLSRFIIGIRKQKNTQLQLQGSTQHSWQKKTCENWRRLLPTLSLDWYEPT